MHKTITLWGIFAFSCLFYFPFTTAEDQTFDDFEFEVPSIYKGAIVPEEKPAPMANLEGEPSAYVHNCVNVITGQFCEFQTDLTVHHGTDPIILERSFAGSTAQTGTLGAGWHLNHASALLFKQISYNDNGFQTYAGLFKDDHGGPPLVFPDTLDRQLTTGCPIHKSCLHKGVTNTSQSYLSGQTNLRNYKCLMIPGSVIVKTGSNRTREYKILPKSKTNIYNLHKELKPNGNRLNYHYTYYDKNHKLSKIEIENQQAKSAGYLFLDPHTKKDFQHLKPLKISTNDGRWVNYAFLKTPDKHILLSHVERSDGPREDYSYMIYGRNEDAFEVIKRKDLPDSRYLQIERYYHGNNHVVHGDVHLKDPLDPRLYRVRSLLAPAGTDVTKVPIYQFVYDLFVVTDKKDPQLRDVRHGSCSVFNAHGYKTQYVFDENQRLGEINKFNRNFNLYTKESLYWGHNESKDNTCLVARNLKEGNQCIFARNYTYDDAGNVLIDSLYGNLSGSNLISPLTDGNGTVIENGCDCYQKFQTHSTDGLNLLLAEYDGTQTTAYEYVPNTNRLSAKFQGTQTQKLRRWFYEYNEDAALVKETTDDGSSSDPNDLSDVTERHFIYYTQSKTYPVAYPLIIEEKCLDLSTGQELPIHKVVNTYTNQAKISKQDHYDNQGVHVYSLFWEYNRMGNITKETDAMGRTITRRYDANGNCVFQKGPQIDCHKIFTYDFMNRLIKEEEVHSDGINHAIHHRYDSASNKIATFDQHGNQTLFVNDEFGRVVETIYPAVLNEDKVACQPITKKSYDSMSNVILDTNSRGIEKKMSYTIRGQLAETIYPDGTTEKNIYNLNGSLKESKTRNNTTTHYTYEPLGRPIKTEIFAENGDLLSTSSITYNGFHVTAEIDPNGVATHYTYFPDGKLKSKQKEKHLIIYFYDSLGRQNKTVEHYGNTDQDTIVKIQHYDLLNRVTEEITADGHENIITKVDYAYDLAGNISLVTNYNESGTSTTESQYNSHGIPIVVKDAQGNKTITQHRYDYRNQLGQLVTYKEITDPLGNIEVSICDALGRATTNLKKNAFGKIIQKQEKNYDLKGNLCSITDTVISKNEPDQKITSLMFYDTSDRLTACYEAHGTPEQKQTKLTYNNLGQKEKLIKNDGVVISHSYDSLGRLESLKSSDDTIHYSYSYDLKGNPIQTIDHISNTKTIRHYDLNDNMQQEELGNNLKMIYTHDHIGRTSKIILPDATQIAYQYRSTHIDTITRLDDNSHPLYTHTYKTYDLSGSLIESLLPEKAGSLTYEYDNLGRFKKSVSTHRTEQVNRYDAIGNILDSSLTDSKGNVRSTYAYDDLYQLIKETGKTTHSYSYDSHYNRRTKDRKVHRLNPLHQLLDDGENTYTYDSNGNLIQKKSNDHTSTLTYDALDRLISFCKDDQKVVYYYDENNRRLSKTFFTQDSDNNWKQQKNTRYLYQGQNEIGAVDEEGKIVELRVLGLGKGAEIGAAVAMELNSKVCIPIHDHIGNVACLLDGATGDVIETYRYSSFGEELFEDAISPWRFSSKRIDPESNLIYFGRRYYDAAIGRWVTPDPIGREGGPNLYAYVLNSPVTHFDLYGLYGVADGAELTSSKFWNFVGNTAKFLATAPGRLLSMVGQNLVPVPYVKDVVDFGGWCLQGQNPTKFQPSWNNSHSKLITHEGNGHGDPHFRHVTYFGIGVTENECKQRLAEYSSNYGGITVYGVYNPTHGFMLDSLEVLCQKLGIPVNAQVVAERETRRIVNEMGEYKNCGTLFVEAHSQGTETVHNLSSNLKRMMDVQALGPARILQKKDFRNAENSIGTLDPVPLLDPVGLVQGLRSGNIHYLPTTGNPYLDHCYNNDGFKRERLVRAEMFKRKYGMAL